LEDPSLGISANAYLALAILRSHRPRERRGTDDAPIMMRANAASSNASMMVKVVSARREANADVRKVGRLPFRTGTRLR